MRAIESRSTVDAKLRPDGSRQARCTPAALRMHAAALFARLRAIAPYALLELLLPGGSVMALLLWLYRRQKKAAVFATHEILSFL